MFIPFIVVNCLNVFQVISLLMGEKMVVFQAQTQDIVPTIGFSIEKFKTSRYLLA